MGAEGEGIPPYVHKVEYFSSNYFPLWTITSDLKKDFRIVHKIEVN